MGGARIRSGPPPDPNSARSDKRNLRLGALPAEGYQGEFPPFPLPRATKREQDTWAAAWRTPQACVWAMPGEQWRHHTIALWVRVTVRCESRDASPSLLAQLHRLADQVGMTAAGLASMGWKIAVDELAAKREQGEPSGPRPRRLRARDRMLALSEPPRTEGGA